jgi:hypothetical protein
VLKVILKERSNRRALRRRSHSTMIDTLDPQPTSVRGEVS